MAQVPKKIAVIGLDAATPHLIEKHIAEGFLPSFRKLFEEGVVAENCVAPFPTITPPNWATIATGAWPGTHGVTDFWVKKPEEPEALQAFGSDWLLAETIWDAADKVGKKCILLNYPGSWPSKMKHGIVVGGPGLAIGEYRDRIPNVDLAVTLCGDQLLTTGTYPRAIRGEFKAAKGWSNAIDNGGHPLEMEARLLFPYAKSTPADTTWYVLARQTGNDSYDQITLSPTKDLRNAFCTLRVGEWSPRVVTHITMKDGSQREVFFRCKLLELSEDGKDFRLFITELAATSGWASPAHVAKQIMSTVGKVAVGAHPHSGFNHGWYDLDTYGDIEEQGCQWLADAATTLLTKNEWDIFFMHAHAPDHMYHTFLTDMDPTLCQDNAKRKRAWDTHLRVYQALDRMLAQIVTVLDRDTLVVLVSDHGATPRGPYFSAYDALAAARLVTFAEQQGTATRPSEGLARGEAPFFSRGKGPFFSEVAFKSTIDPKKSKAIAHTHIHINVNLKGREPEGIVDPDEYEKVRQEIIDALLRYIDPQTGQRPVAIALSNKDARLLGMYGDRIGDVVYAVYPWYGGNHGGKLPGGEWGIGSLKPLLVLSGPGVKKGHRLQRTAWLTDLVPTICYLMDLPVPEQAEGAVLYQALNNPNLKLR